jgi:hypothetical protein
MLSRLPAIYGQSYALVAAVWMRGKRVKDALNALRPGAIMVIVIIPMQIRAFLIRPNGSGGSNPSRSIVYRRSPKGGFFYWGNCDD